MTNHKPIPVKLVVVGDGAVGKTCLLVSYAKGKFPEEYVPVFENYSTQLLLDDKAIDLGLWDTAGQETYKNLRPLSYEMTSIFCICFSLVDRTSFDNVSENWYPEVHDYNKEVPVCLVGTKKDLRDDEEVVEKLKERGGKPIETAEGEQLAQNLGPGTSYFECSAKTEEGLKEVFIGACRIVLGDKKKKKSGGGCDIL